MGAIEGTIVALVMEGGNAAAWSIHWDSKLFAAAYSGVICSGVAYYVGAMVIQAKGPVFFAAFNPLTMVIVAIMSSFIFSEIMYLGRVIGVIVIVVGLYLVLWGKSKDQHSSDSDSNKAAAAPRSGEQMATIGNETAAVTSNQDFVLLDWGKSKDQPSSNLDVDMEPSSDQKMTAMDEITVGPNQDFVVLDVTSNRVTPTDESV
ncbi:EamA domain - like 10 [Theobroma cacao]|nr:EamA domain - like 10 [Theobroma cacao]